MTDTDLQDMESGYRHLDGRGPIVALECCRGRVLPSRVESRVEGGHRTSRPVTWFCPRRSIHRDGMRKRWSLVLWALLCCSTTRAEIFTSISGFDLWSIVAQRLFLKDPVSSVLPSNQAGGFKAEANGVYREYLLLLREVLNWKRSIKPNASRSPSVSLQAK